MSAPIDWTEDMVSTLRDLRERKGEPLLECASRIGVCYPVVMRQAQRMGLNKRRNNGRVRGIDAVASGSSKLQNGRGQA